MPGVAVGGTSVLVGGGGVRVAVAAPGVPVGAGVPQGLSVKVIFRPGVRIALL
jgi:hypothetical protein